MPLPAVQGDRVYFLDRFTGEIFFVPSALEDEDFWRQIETNQERFLEIPRFDYSIERQIMSGFIGSIEDMELKNLLSGSLAGRKPYGNINDILSFFPDEQERLLEMKDEFRHQPGQILARREQPVYRRDGCTCSPLADLRGRYAAHSTTESTPRNDYGRLIAAILLLCLLAAAGYALQHTISCFLLSWIIAYLLDPLVVQAEERGMKRIYALALLYVVLGVLTIFFLTFMVPKLTMSWDAFLRDLPQYHPEDQTDRHGMEGTASPTATVRRRSSGCLTRSRPTSIPQPKRPGPGPTALARRIFFNLFNIILSPILVFFMLYYKQTVIETLASWIPENSARYHPGHRAGGQQQYRRLSARPGVRFHHRGVYWHRWRSFS